MKLLLALILASLLFAGMAVYQGIHQNDCNHGESSVSGHFETNKAGKTIFITDHPAHRTGC